MKAADGDYMRLSGTSMATAVASGSIALMLEANRAANYGHPALTPNAVKAVLQYTALGVHDDLGVEYNALRKGAGALNARGAIEIGQSIDTSRPMGQYWLTNAPSPWTTIGGETNTWSQGIIWGSSIIWGTSTYYNEMAWGTSIIWGTSDSNSIVWARTTAPASSGAPTSSGPTRRRGLSRSSGAPISSGGTTARASSGARAPAWMRNRPDGRI